MECPRCKLPLTAERYEGFEVELCHGCWGLWLDPGELEKILASRSYRFTDEEKARLADGVSRSPNPVTPVACPKCSRRMERLYIDPTIRLVIDRCPGHGVWLDTGEIKTMQVLAEKTREFYRLIVDTVRRGSPGRK